MDNLSLPKKAFNDCPQEGYIKMVMMNFVLKRAMLVGKGNNSGEQCCSLSAEFFQAFFCFSLLDFNPLPNDKILDGSKLKALTDDKSGSNDDFSL